MEIRHPYEEEIPALKTVWKICFGDTDEYIDNYFTNGFHIRYTFIAVVKGEVAAMLTVLPCMMGTSSHIHKGGYVYAVATLPQFRGTGLMAKLMGQAEQDAVSLGYRFLCLVPASESLFTLYARHGYQTESYLGQASFAVNDYRNDAASTHFEQPAAEYFIRLRQLYLSRLPFTVQLDGNMQEYLPGALLAAGSEILSVQNRFGHGYVVFSHKAQTLSIREIGMPRACFFSALAPLADRFGAATVCVCANMDFFEEHDVPHPYGMVKYLEQAQGIPDGEPFYMNLMLD